MWSVSLWRLSFIVSRKFQRVRLPYTMCDSWVSLWFPGVIVSKVFQRAKSPPRCATQGCPWRRAPRTRAWIVDLTQVTATLPRLPARGDTQSQSRWGYKICLTSVLHIWRVEVQEYFAKTEKRFKEVVFTNRVTPQVLTPPLTAVWAQYKPPALKSCSTSTGYSTRASSSASTIIWSGSTVTTLAVVYEYEAPAWQPEVAE